jgi:hypothetical protein
MRKLGLAILLGLTLAYTLSPVARAKPPGIRDVIVEHGSGAGNATIRPVAQAKLSSPQVVTVENGPGADDAAIQKAIQHPRKQPITILLRPGSLEAGTCYSISGPIDLASNVTIDSTSTTDRWCMQRATLPRDPNSPSPELFWFRVAGAAVDNFTMRNANLYGLGPGDVSFEKQASYVDRGLVFSQPSMRDPQNLSQYSKNLTLEHVTFDKFYGVCVFLQYVNGLSFDDVVCNDPTKGGLIFTFGTRNGIIKNSVSTLTGDDAMAVTSGSVAPGGALVTNIDVQNAHLTQEQNDQGCGTLCFRGADDIVITESDVGAGSGVGAIGIRTSTDAAHQWSNSNIEVSSTVIRPDEDESGVHVSDPGASNIQITDNSITYKPPKCGIRLSPSTPTSEITTSSNIFDPSDKRSLCGILGWLAHAPQDAGFRDGARS